MHTIFIFFLILTIFKISLNLLILINSSCKVLKILNKRSICIIFIFTLKLVYKFCEISLFTICASFLRVIKRQKFLNLEGILSINIGGIYTEVLNIHVNYIIKFSQELKWVIKFIRVCSHKAVTRGYGVAGITFR